MEIHAEPIKTEQMDWLFDIFEISNCFRIRNFCIFSIVALDLMRIHVYI